MRVRRLLPVALLTLATLAGVAMAPIGETQARWHRSLTLTLPDGATDRFTSAAADVDSPRGPVTNTPSLTATNTGERHQAWVNVQSTRVDPGTLGGQPLASVLGLSYAIAPVGGTCASGATAYSTVRATGQITTGTTYTRAPDRVPSAVASPGQTRLLCPTFVTSLSNRNLWLGHGGRDLVVRTVLAQRAEAPATWESGSETVDSRFRVAFPRPTPWNDAVGTLSNSCSGSGTGALLKWAWPDGAVQGTTATPAVDAWEVWRRQSGTTGAWVLLGTAVAANRSGTLPSGALAQGTFDLKIIARLDTARSAWVESTHRITVRQGASLGCVSAGTNAAPNPGGPVVLP